MISKTNKSQPMQQLTLLGGHIGYGTKKGDEMDREFEIGDLVEQCNQNDCILRVSGVIDDDKRLFVVDDSENPFRLNKGREFEIPFSKVTCQWRKVT